MSNLFAGLESLGLKVKKDIDVFEEEKKEEAGTGQGAENKPKEISEESLLFEKTHKCPVCDTEFKCKMVRTGKAKLVSQDMDLRPKYQGIDPLKYDAILCPTCGYASLNRYFNFVMSSQAKQIKEQISIPLIADIHFNYKFALECAERGIDAIRINPGNIGGEEKVKAVADACRLRGIPIRVGVNGGSLEKELRAKYGGVTAEALVESALGQARLLNRFDFDDICFSVKCSDVPLTMAAYLALSERTDYPLHLGVTFQLFVLFLDFIFGHLQIFLIFPSLIEEIESGNGRKDHTDLQDHTDNLFQNICRSRNRIHIHHLRNHNQFIFKDSIQNRRQNNDLQQ